MRQALIASAANAAWFASAWPSYHRFCAMLKNPRPEQEAILRDYLRRNAETDFGRRFAFSRIGSVGEFQKRVPVHDYDALAPAIARIAAGEQRVLTSEPVLRLATSSGSTGARKLIPYTARLQGEFNRAIGPWIVDLYRRDPQLARGCAYWSITPFTGADETPPARNAPPIGFAEDSAYLGGIRKRLIDAVMAVPGDVRCVNDINEFRRATLRHLLRHRDLRLISVWHPSFLELLLDAAGPHDWTQVWPKLRLISCWADAHAAGPAAALARRFPGVRIQPKGLLATEAFISIPFANAWPLAVRSHFFEFLMDDGTPRLVDELEAGRSYSVAVTTAGGLWRYRLGDQIKVEGFVDRTPSVRFIGREDSVVDRFGEKLSEQFVGSAIRSTLAACGLTAQFAMLAPEPIGSCFRYTLFIQSATELSSELAERLDAALRANPHYDYCRALGQLRPAAVCQIPGDAFARFAAHLQERGARLGDIKPAALSEQTTWRETLLRTELVGGERRDRSSMTSAPPA